jgi:hypothetical protein
LSMPSLTLLEKQIQFVVDTFFTIIIPIIIATAAAAAAAAAAEKSRHSRRFLLFAHFGCLCRFHFFLCR